MRFAQPHAEVPVGDRVLRGRALRPTLPMKDRRRVDVESAADVGKAQAGDLSKHPTRSACGELAALHNRQCAVCVGPAGHRLDSLHKASRGPSLICRPVVYAPCQAVDRPRRTQMDPGLQIRTPTDPEPWWTCEVRQEESPLTYVLRYWEEKSEPPKFVLWDVTI